jgi:adenylate cyclase
MTVLRRFLGRNDRSLVPAGFRDALTREILLTEILRIKAVIVTVSLLLVAALSAIFFLAPSGLVKVLHGRFDLVRLYAVYVPFLLVELWGLHLVTRRVAGVAWGGRGQGI